MKRNRLKRIAGKLRHPLRNAASILLTLIVLSTAMTLWTNSQTAHALKFRIDQLLHENGELSVSSRDSEGNDKDVISMKITDPKELTAVKRQIPELRIPENLPEGYEFSAAEVERWENEEWKAVLRYVFSEEKYFSLEEACHLNEFNLFLEMGAEEIVLPKTKAYYIEENEGSRGIYAIMNNNNTVLISGTAEKEELMEVAEDLQKQ